MKKAALQAMEAAKPVNVAFGTVVNVNPLMICVEQKMTLGMGQLILSRNVTDHDIDVTDHDIDVTVDWSTESALTTHRHGIGTEEEMLVTMEGGDPVHTHDIPPSFTGYTNLAHRHGISGRKKMRVHLGLTLGEHVVLLRLQGGQQYLVWDRVV
ncbi:MAG: DUF2577 domain-containing protein [Clostridia bacterium]|nr:DUF2577 domain-containing protein [Clostridia bacterium]